MEPEVKIEYGDSGRFVVFTRFLLVSLVGVFFVGLGPYLNCKEQIEAEFLFGLLLAWTLGLNLKGGKQKFKRKKQNQGGKSAFAWVTVPPRHFPSSALGHLLPPGHSHPILHSVTGGPVCQDTGRPAEHDLRKRSPLPRGLHDQPRSSRRRLTGRGVPSRSSFGTRSLAVTS